VSGEAEGTLCTTPTMTSSRTHTSDPQHDAKGKFQFGLLSLLWMVGACAFLLWLLRDCEDFLGFSLIASIGALAVGIFFRDTGWRCVAWAWSLVFAIPTVFLFELASGYGWKLPLIGVVPGPPTPFIHLCVQITAFSTVILGSVFSLGCVVLGSTAQRLLSIVPMVVMITLLCLWVNVTFF